MQLICKLESIEKAFVSRLCVGVDDKSAFEFMALVCKRA